MTTDYNLGTHLLEKQESINLLKYGLPAKTADFIIIEEPGKGVKIKYIDNDLGMKNLLGSMSFNEDSPFIPTWSTGRLIELYVLGFSTDFYASYDRGFNLKEQIYTEILEGLKTGSGNFSPESLNYELPRLPLK